MWTIVYAHSQLNDTYFANCDLARVDAILDARFSCFKFQNNILKRILILFLQLLKGTLSE